MNDFTSYLKRFILIAGDVVLLYLVLVSALAIRYRENFTRGVWDIHFWPFSIMFALWLAVFYISGLYDWRNSRNGINFYTAVFRTLLANSVIAVIYFYVFSSRLFSIRPQVVFLFYIAIFSLLFLLWRRFYNHLTETQVFRKNILCLGGGNDMSALIKEMRDKPYYGYRVVEHFTAEQLRDNMPDLKRLLVENRVDTVVTSLELNQYPEIVSQFYKNLFLGVMYVDLPTFYENLTGRVPVSTIGQLWFLENISENEKKYYELTKRALEIFFTCVFGAFGLILAPFIAIAIKISSPGPVIFSQSRVGRQGKIFRAMKFRTMVVGSEKSGPQWTKVNDDRITGLGKFLRKTKLDEIPQLVNIFRGEMSYIGPRPEQPEFVADLTKKIPYYNERHLIKPGLTGWAQIHFPQSSASPEDSLVKLQYDLYYIKNRSLLLDAGIILKTINTILSGQGR